MKTNFFSKCLLAYMLSLVAIYVVVPTVGWAQTDRGAVGGTVTDPHHLVVGNAIVTLKNEETGVSQTLKVNSDGLFVFQNLNPGRYALAVSAPSFKKFAKDHMQVDVGQRVDADVSLVPGSTDITVVVNGGIQQLDTESADLGLIVEEKSVTDLPLIYGNPYTLGALASGVTLSGVNPNVHVYDSSSGNVSVHGSSLNSVDYKLDGAPDNRIRSSAYTPSTEFISQFKMGTSNFNAAEGHSSGAFMNTQLKSGTNRLRGSAFAYYQNPKINSSYWVPPSSIAVDKPTFVREGFGLGGPFWKNRAFWFIGYEHSRQSDIDTQSSLVVPTDAEKGGDFSAYYALDTSTTAYNVCTSNGTLTDPTKTGNAYQVYYADSNVTSAAPTTSSNTAYIRSCVPGNKLTTIDPVAKAYLAYYPEPINTSANPGSSNYSYGQAEPDMYHAIATRVDYTISPQQSIYSHLVWSSRSQPTKNNYFPPFSATALVYNNRGVVFGYTRVLGVSSVLNVVGAYTRFTNSNIAGDEGVVGPTTIGMPSYLTKDLSAFANSMPIITATGYTALTSSTGTISADDIWLGSASYSRQIGKHTINAGVEFRMYNTNAMTGSGAQGSYTAKGDLALPKSTSSEAHTVAFSLAQLEQGYLSSGSQTQNADIAIRSDYYAGYIQDDWRILPKLTLNMGLRWELETPDIERNNKEAVAFDFSATNSTTNSAAATNYATIRSGSTTTLQAILPTTFTSTGGLKFAATSGNGRAPYISPKKDFLPRFGFAYALNNKTVIRGGYGIFFDSLNSFYLSGGNAGSTSTFLVPQQGFSATTSVTAPTYTNSTGLVITSTLDDPFSGSLTAPTGNTLGTSTSLGQTVLFLVRKPSVPYSQRFSLGVQHQFGHWVSSVDYVGAHSIHMLMEKQYNNIPQSYYSTQAKGYDYTVNTNEATSITNPFVVSGKSIIPSGASYNLATSKTYVYQLQKPYPEYGQLEAYNTTGRSIYHSMQANLQRRFTNGLSTTVAYTWSRTLDATSFLNTTDSKPWYGTSSNDRPQRLAVSGIYQLPFGHGRRFLSTGHGVLTQIAGGWQAQGVYQIQSGAPLSFSANGYYSGTNPGNSHWSRSAYKKTIANGTSGEGTWFNPANWLSDNKFSTTTPVSCTSTLILTDPTCPNSLPGTYQIRTMPLRFNTLRADHLNQADLGVQRQFQIHNVGTFQLRMEAVNVLNHPVYSAPSVSSYSSTSFGLITAQGNQPRVFQFAGFLRF